MALLDAQHCTWFFASLTPYLRLALSQQNISIQAEALEVAMRLHETPIQDPMLGVQQIQVKIQNLCLETRRLKQLHALWIEAWEEVWCIKCKGQDHNKDHCPTFMNYVAGGGPISLRLEI